MATPEQRREKCETVRAVLADLASVDPHSLARSSDLSPDINFNDAVPHFEEMLDLCKQLNQRDISRLTTQQLDAINKACNKLVTHIKQVRDFDLNQNTPGDVCNSIIEQIKDAYDGVMNPLLLPLAFTATQATDYAKIEREAKGYHTTMKVEAEKLDTFLTTARRDAESALAAVKEQAAEAGVSNNAQIFLKDAVNHASLAGKWMSATILMGSLTFGAAMVSVVVAIKYQPADTAA